MPSPTSLQDTLHIERTTVEHRRAELDEPGRIGPVVDLRKKGDERKAALPAGDSIHDELDGTHGDAGQRKGFA
jgi:hypothetical protein